MAVDMKSRAYRLSWSCIHASMTGQQCRIHSVTFQRGKNQFTGMKGASFWHPGAGDQDDRSTRIETTGTTLPRSKQAQTRAYHGKSARHATRATQGGGSHAARSRTRGWGVAWMNKWRNKIYSFFSKIPYFCLEKSSIFLKIILDFCFLCRIFVASTF